MSENPIMTLPQSGKESLLSYILMETVTLYTQGTDQGMIRTSERGVNKNWLRWHPIGGKENLKQQTV